MFDRIASYDGSSEFMKDIPPGARLLVVGTGPGGIDVARLALNAKVESVIMVSRNGRISRVQPCTRDNSYELEVESRVRFLEAMADAKGGRLSADFILRELFDLIQAVSPTFSWERFLRAGPDAADELEEDIKQAKKGGASWQKIIFPIGTRIPRIWQLLTDHDRDEFLYRYDSAWMVHRHAMPLQTAEQVLVMLKSGFLRVGTLCDRPVKRDDDVIVRVDLRPGGPQAAEVTHIVIATGPNYACNAESRNTLIRTIIESCFAESHPFGGFKLKSNCLRLKNREQIYCIGAMTRGERLYVNSMPVLVQQATEIGQDILRRISQGKELSGFHTPEEVGFAKRHEKPSDTTSGGKHAGSWH